MQPFETSGRREQIARLRKLATKALADCDLGAVTFSLRLHLANTTFCVVAEDGAKYVLRICEPGAHSLEEVRSEAAWVAALRRETGLGVPAARLTRDGEPVIVVESEGVSEPRICILLQWQEGRFRRRGLRPVHLKRAGAFMAQLHQHSATYTLPDGFTRPRYTADHLVGDWLAHDALGPEAARIAPADRAVLDAAAARAQTEIAALGTTPDRFRLIHADLHQGNVLYFEDEARAIDFDDTGFGHLLLDIATTFWGLSLQPNVAELRAAFCDGYQAIAPLPPGYDTHLDAFIAARFLMTTGYVLKRAPKQPNLKGLVARYVRWSLEFLRTYAER